MTKLDWDDSHTNYGPRYRADYKGLTIWAKHDDCPSNPFKEWDGHWPMVVDTYQTGRNRFTEYATDDAFGMLDLFSDEQLVHDQKAISSALGYDVYDLMVNEGYDEPTKWCTDAVTLRDLFSCAWGDIADSAKLRIASDMYDLLGIPNLLTSSSGYSQGDRVEILIIATPEAQAKLRSKPADMDDETWAKTLKADMEHQRDLYGAWAWGDVYGYVIEDADGNEIDSCWSYYGSEFDESGLEEAAIEAADHHLLTVRRKRADKLKQLIASRVPLVYRPELLEMAA